MGGLHRILVRIRSWRRVRRCCTPALATGQSEEMRQALRRGGSARYVFGLFFTVKSEFSKVASFTPYSEATLFLLSFHMVPSATTTRGGQARAAAVAAAAPMPHYCAGNYVRGCQKLGFVLRNLLLDNTAKGRSQRYREKDNARQFPGGGEGEKDLRLFLTNHLGMEIVTALEAQLHTCVLSC